MVSLSVQQLDFKLSKLRERNYTEYLEQTIQNAPYNNRILPRKDTFAFRKSDL